ncbi:VOC family protein [Dactylosporangium siamense]|uniref:2,3-dihydroxybiphenyl 1,2-dioxygenase n=1 Tax=Dactylosporangium siamense TaxID=685454 RepID=A0A919UDX4_9ACTN|nr:VOC family protein [Dactylosporangium siamense]GIG47083.1 2,3-dihydroxybiphenyl 1,2-dioxygenase [Dactylosporangium siamense]
MSKIAALGYLVVRGPLEEWKRFGTQVLGAQLIDGPDAATAMFRTDDRAFRIVVQDGPPGPDALVALGFEVADDAALNALVAELTAAAVPVEEDPRLAQLRRVRRLVRFADLDGNVIEAHVGQESSNAPFVSPRGIRFVCGDLGLGHVFLFTGDGQKAAGFYTSVLGFRISDTIAFGPENGIFLRCNPRHHTVAFAAIPGPPPGIGHLMVEVDSLEAVGRALDLVERDHQVQMSLGEHTNDRMTSFYVLTPSGFAVEYGWNGKLVEDDATWKVGHYDSPSVWGHHFTAPPPPPPGAGVAAAAGAGGEG